jgi:hypothetical protein
MAIIFPTVVDTYHNEYSYPTVLTEMPVWKIPLTRFEWKHQSMRPANGSFERSSLTFQLLHAGALDY